MDEQQYIPTAGHWDPFRPLPDVKVVPRKVGPGWGDMPPARPYESRRKKKRKNYWVMKPAIVELWKVRQRIFDILLASPQRITAGKIAKAINREWKWTMKQIRLLQSLNLVIGVESRRMWHWQVRYRRPVDVLAIWKARKKS